MMPNYHTIEKHDKMFHDEQSCIVIDDGEYENIIIQYDVIKFSEDNDLGKLDFNFIICENPNDLDLTTKEFKTILGDILVKELEEYLELSLIHI